MKKQCLLLSSLLLFTSAALAQENDDVGFAFPTTNDYPAIRRSGKRVSDFVPRDWKIEDRADGDLNGDKLKDCAIYIKGNLPEYKQKNKEGLGVDILDTNPRMLLILFVNPVSKEYKLAEKSNSFIPISESPTVEEQFKDISIKNGVLKVDFTYWCSAGSWSTSDTSYLFRYQDKKFVLIGANKCESQRNSGKQETCSFNFLTGKVKVTTGSFNSEDKSKEQTKWQNIGSCRLRTLSSFESLYHWQVIPDHYL